MTQISPAQARRVITLEKCNIGCVATLDAIQSNVWWINIKLLLKLLYTARNHGNHLAVLEGMLQGCRFHNSFEMNSD